MKTPAKTQTAGQSPGILFRTYQQPVFLDRETGILVLHWSRQIGKSFTLASWAVDRLLSQLQRHENWLITVLSNSRDNGAEFVLKCQDICRRLGFLLEQERQQADAETSVYVADDSADIRYENMRMEVRVTVNLGDRPRTGRIKVLAANPRTARGFSGDLILDEFAFHEDSAAIWEAAEPILSSHPEYLCRIASTGNGKHNMFYRLASGAGPYDGTPFRSTGGFLVSRVSRTAAWGQGVTVYDPATRKPLTPAQAEAQALDKRAYRQNYECEFNDENMVLLTHELISAAERSPIQIDHQAWSETALQRLRATAGGLEIGVDVGRHRDLSVICVLERQGDQRRVLGLLRLSGLRLPAQQAQLDLVCALPNFRRAEIDMTGIGLGLCEYAQEQPWGARIHGVNFSRTEPLSTRLKQEGRKQETARVTELMAADLLAVFEDRSIEIPADHELRADLRKPERLTSPGGRVSIAATRDEAGHADHFWALALAVRAGNQAAPDGLITSLDGIRTGCGHVSVFQPRHLRPAWQTEARSYARQASSPAESPVPTAARDAARNNAPCGGEHSTPTPAGLSEAGPRSINP